MKDVIALAYGNATPNPARVPQIMPMVMGLTDTSIRCATGELTATGLQGLPPIPQTGDAAEEAALFARVSTGQGTLQEMMRYDALVMARRDADRAAKAQAQADRDSRAASNRARLKATYEAELARIHARDLSDWPIPEYETVFLTYCAMGGGTDGECACGWGKVTDLAKSHVLPYLASRSEGDDVFDHLTQGEFYGNFQALSLLNTRRAACDGM